RRSLAMQGRSVIHRPCATVGGGNTIRPLSTDSLTYGERAQKGIATAMDITELLAFSAKQGASDLHLSAGLPPMIRVDGDVRRINLPPLEHREVHALVYEIMNDKKRKDYEEFLETDFSVEVPRVARFRVNAFNQNRGAGAVFRTIPSKVLTMEDLGMGQVFKDISMVPRGLVLVT